MKVIDLYDQEGVQGYLCQVDGLDGAFVAVKDDIERIINGFSHKRVLVLHVFILAMNIFDSVAYGRLYHGGNYVYIRTHCIAWNGTGRHP